MTLAVTAPELQQLLASLTFTRNFGFQFHSMGDGECSIAVPFQPAFERPGGIVSVAECAGRKGRLLAHHTITYMQV